MSVTTKITPTGFIATCGDVTVVGELDRARERWRVYASIDNFAMGQRDFEEFFTYAPTHTLAIEVASWLAQELYTLKELRDHMRDAEKEVRKQLQVKYE